MEKHEKQPAGELLQAFGKYGELLQCKKGRSIYFQEDPADAFYMVKSGMLRSYVMASDGKEITLELLRPGKVFGSVSFFMGIERIASVVALTDAEVVVLNQESIRQCFGEHYGLATEIIRALGATTQFLVSQVENLTIISAEHRVAHTLLQLALEFKEHGEDTGYNIPYTHQQIAELAGLSRVATTKELNRFAEKGWVELGYRAIRVQDEQALRGVYSRREELRPASKM